jgi:hypothetical protein
MIVWSLISSQFGLLPSYKWTILAEYMGLLFDEGLGYTLLGLYNVYANCYFEKRPTKIYFCIVKFLGGL